MKNTLGEKRQRDAQPVQDIARKTNHFSLSSRKTWNRSSQIAVQKTSAEHPESDRKTTH